MFGGSRIRSVFAREILDSRGNPTVACRVTLRSGVSAEASVPSGASTGAHEAVELRDNGKRYGGKGVLKAVIAVNRSLAPLLRGIDACKQLEVDRLILERDGTEDKSRLGANALLSVSLACTKVTALYRRVPLWQSLRRTFDFGRKASLPFPTMNVLNGGAHADWCMDVQEYMIVPQQRTMAERVRAGAETFHTLAALLKEQGFATTVGDEGGFAPRLPHAESAFALLVEASQRAGYYPGKEMLFAADLASSEWYDAKTKNYHLRTEGKKYTAAQLGKRYLQWIKTYPILSLEDPFAEDDWRAWTSALPVFRAHHVLLVGDDLFATNAKRLERGIKEKAASAILIKLNQIGTVTETVEAIKKAHQAGWATSISHRSGETAETFIADLAVACGSEYIKTGSLSRSERVEKYNRLMEIEWEMKMK